MNRHKIRENSMVCVYQNLICNKDIEETIEDVFKNDEIDDFARTIIYSSIENKDRYIEYINKIMSNYTFDRLGYIEQAILLMGCSEFDNKTTYSSIIIDEYVLIAKKYCDEDAYKIINSVLDRI